MINILKRKLNKIFLVMAIFILPLTNFVYAEDNTVNTDSADIEKSSGGLAGDTELFYDDARGARVSLWDVESQTLVYSITMMDYDRSYWSELKKKTTNLSYEEAKNYRRLSNMTNKRTA